MPLYEGFFPIFIISNEWVEKNFVKTQVHEKKMSLQKVFHTTFCLLHPHLIFMQLDAAYAMYASYVELG